jgi:hypothetical protein
VKVVELNIKNEIEAQQRKDIEEAEGLELETARLQYCTIELISDASEKPASRAPPASSPC